MKGEKMSVTRRLNAYLYFDKGDQKRDTIRRGDYPHLVTSIGEDQREGTILYTVNFQIPEDSLPKNQSLARIVIELDE